MAAPIAVLVLSKDAATALVAAQPAPPAGSLPPNVHLMSLDRVALEYSPPSAAGRYLLRLRHMFQEGEHPKWAVPATVDLSTVLPDELALAGVVELPLNGVGVGVPVPSLASVVVHPMQTKTFEVTMEHAFP